MTEEARVETLESGLAPMTEGWFTVNVREAAWQMHPEFGARCTFELGRRVLGDRDDLEPLASGAAGGLGRAAVGRVRQSRPDRRYSRALAASKSGRSSSTSASHWPSRGSCRSG